jgi:hypothetical protein
VFLAGFNQKIKKKDQNIKKIKLNHDENYSRRFQRTPEDTTPQWTLRG